MPNLTSHVPPLVCITRSLPGEVSIDNAEIRMHRGPRLEHSDLHDFIRGADAVITWVTERIDRDFLEAAGDQLQIVANYAVGYDNIDLDACRERGVVVTNTPDAVTEGTANIAIALMLAVARRLIEADRFVRSGDWARRGVLGPDEFLGMDLADRTILIVGAGRIGHATALRARAFGMRVLYVARSAKPGFESEPIAGERMTLEEGLPRADVVSVHVPLTDETRHLIDAGAIARMKPGAILVNTARGPVVDESALADALSNGHPYGAGLDVFEREPEIDPRLVELDNVVLTPHIGSGERRWRAEMTRMACANVEAVLKGEEPANRVV